jgi:hypothetical protein
MTGDRWKTVFSFGSDGNRRMTPVPVAGGITLPAVAPPSNFHVSATERLARAALPEPRVSMFELGYLRPFETDLKPKPTPADESQEVPEQARLLPVVQPPAPKVTPDEQAALLTGPIGSRLENLTCNGDLDQRRQDLLARLRELTKSLAVFFRDQRAWLVADLTAQQEQTARKCREQERVIADFEAQFDEQMGTVRLAAGQTSSCRVLLASCDDAEKPNLDNWPSRVEMARWEAKHKRLSEALRAAEQAEDQARSKLSDLRVQVLTEQRKLNALADAELVLRQRLSGEPWSDHEFGLEHPAEL